MKPTPASVATPTDLDPDLPAKWVVTVLAGHEPLLLARVLQKFAVPEIELCGAHYEADAAAGMARVALTIRARPARARLAAARLQNLLQVRQVELTAGAESPVGAEDGFA